MKSIESVIQQLVSDNQMEEEFMFSKISNVWNDNFPDAFKANIKISAFKDKTLYLNIKSPVWRKEAQIISDKIINSLNNLLKEKLIEKIVIKEKTKQN